MKRVCKYCGGKIPDRIKQSKKGCCYYCSDKIAIVKQFREACEELKRIIGYDAILAKREREGR